MEYSKWKKEIQELLNEKEMDEKDWHRAIGMDQMVLMTLMNSDSCPIEENILDSILEQTKKAKKTELPRFQKPIIIAFWTHKGGTGKSTISSNIAYELSRRQYNVLTIDTDSQCDMSSTLFPQYNSEEFRDKNFYDAFVLRSDFVEDGYVVHTDYDNLDIVPGSLMCEAVETSISQYKDDIIRKLFRRSLETVIRENYYDFVIVDMDKNAGQLNKAILCQCDYVLSPLECAPYSVKSTPNINSQIEKIQQLNPSLKWLGIIFNKVDLRKAVVETSKQTVNSFYPGIGFENFIKTDSNFERSQENFMPIGVYERSSKGSKQIGLVTDEMIERIKKDLELEGDMI